jgi:hypothetical protein
VALIVFTPMALAIYQIAQQSDVLASWVTQSRDNGIKVPEWITRLPIAAEHECRLLVLLESEDHKTFNPVLLNAEQKGQ